MNKLLLLLIITYQLLSCSATIFAQALPSTDIYLIPVIPGKGELALGQPKNITHRDGYDNQPSFLADGKNILYTSIREDAQADIYRYDIEKDTSVRVTNTPESEYSATLMPDGTHFSVVRVEKDTTQRLWKFNLDGTNPELVLKSIKPVGYHCWLDSQWVALFILGEPNFLVLTDIRTEKPITVANNIGRSLHTVPGANGMSFVEKLTDSTWYIKAFDFETKYSAMIIRTLPDKEDFAWLPDGTILMADGSTLFKFNVQSDTSWTQLTDFSNDGITSITRIAVSPDGSNIAIVGIPEKK